MWVWALAGAVLGYVVYRHYKGTSGDSGFAQEVQTVQAQTPSQAMGLQPSAGNGIGGAGGGDQTTFDYLGALGGQQATLLQAIEAVNQDVAGLAASQLAYAQTQTTFGSFSTQTGMQVGDQPGGANAPVTGFVSPTVVNQPTLPAASNVAARSSAAGSGGNQPYGGVVSTKKLKNGSLLTTYASGRQVQQVPGKTPYVVRA